MRDNTVKNIGMELLIQQYKKKFEIEENIKYYTHKDFNRAERKYIKFVLGNSDNTPINQIELH
ncbi:hypothetical protein [Desulfobacula sp.]|uniref:hypothetical protein n=1 Tax=Desulfobacula sp. TaxID=2593537 RepID=UPI0026128E06|nr:hypothetical protein [Desulfobacula sp.]